MEIDVIGGISWSITNMIESTTINLEGGLVGMGERCLLIVSAVTAYHHVTEGTILIGHKQVSWEDQPK